MQRHSITFPRAWDCGFGTAADFDGPGVERAFFESVEGGFEVSFVGDVLVGEELLEVHCDYPFRVRGAGVAPAGEHGVARTTNVVVPGAVGWRNPLVAWVRP